MVSRLRLACPSRLSPTAHQAGAAEYAQIQTPRLRQLHNGLKADTQKPFFVVCFDKTRNYSVLFAWQRNKRSTDLRARV